MFAVSVILYCCDIARLSSVVAATRFRRCRILAWRRGASIDTVWLKSTTTSLRWRRRSSFLIISGGFSSTRITVAKTSRTLKTISVGIHSVSVCVKLFYTRTRVAQHFDGWFFIVTRQYFCFFIFHCIERLWSDFATSRLAASDASGAGNGIAGMASAIPIRNVVWRRPYQ